MNKTTCPEHRRVGYAYAWSTETGTFASTLTCKGCGLPPAQHETISETIARLTTEGK